MKTGRTWHTEDEVRRMKDYVVLVSRGEENRG